MADPYAWSKLDPMAMYGYGGAGLLGEGEVRDLPAYSPPWPDVPRTNSAFSSLQQQPAQTVTKTQEFETTNFPARQNSQVEIF